MINLTWGAIEMTRTSGEQKYFHEMNFYWNTVNLVLGASGYIGSKMKEPMSFSELNKKHQLAQKVYLFNSALDIAYITSGWGVYNKAASSSAENAKKYRGYGRSVILQGSFLFGIRRYDERFIFLRKQKIQQYLETCSNSAN